MESPDTSAALSEVASLTEAASRLGTWRASPLQKRRIKKGSFLVRRPKLPKLTLNRLLILILDILFVVTLNKIFLVPKGR
jgi:hypothetical protein